MTPRLGVFETMWERFALKWGGLAILIGIAAGIGAILFDLAATLMTVLALRDIADSLPPAPAGEGETELDTVVGSIGHPVLLPFVVAVGGLIAGLLVSRFSPESAGGGNDSVITSYHYQAGDIRGRVPFVKLVASAITIGSGGSAGREGPSAQISAGFGSAIARWLNLSVADRRMCVLIGMGAGIGAIFRAPLGGAILGSEMLYREDLESDALIPGLIASIVSYSVFSSYAGWEPLFGAQTHVIFNSPVQLIHFAALGVLAGGLGVLFVRCYRATERYFSRLTWPLPAKTTVAGFAVGLIGALVPQTLESGYGWAQLAIDGGLSDLALWLVLLLPIVKIVTTSLTVGSGTPGGLFGPGVFIGAMLGTAYWRAFHDLLPGMPPQPASMTIISMIALLGAVAHVPLAAMILIAEMTRNLSLLAPAMIAVGIATFIVRDETLFEHQVPTQADSPVHRHQYAFPLLSSLTATDALRTAQVVLNRGLSIEQAEQLLHKRNITGAPVIDDDGVVIGLLNDRDIAEYPEPERVRKRVSDAMRGAPLIIDRSVALDEAFDLMVTGNVAWLPVRDRETLQLAGIVTYHSILTAYRRALTRKVRRTQSMTVGSTLLEVQVTENSPLYHCPVREIRLPDDALLVTYTRGGVVRFPHGETVFESGDIVGVVTSIAAEERIRRFLEADGRQPGPAPDVELPDASPGG